MSSTTTTRPEANAELSTFLYLPHDRLLKTVGLRFAADVGLSLPTANDNNIATIKNTIYIYRANNNTINEL